MAALLVSLTMAASYRAARCFLPNRLAALAIAVGCNAILVSLACRPHQFTHLGLAALSWIIASFQSGNRRALYWIPPLFAVWVNLHGGYAFGLTYLGMVASLTAIEAYMRHEPTAMRQGALPLFAFTGVALFATLLNPYGWGAWQYAIEIANMKASAGIVDEWAATNIKTDVGINFFIVTSAMVAALAMTRSRPKLSQILAALALTALGWSAVRLSLMVTVLMVPIVAAAVRDTPFYDLVFNGPKSRHYDREVGIGKAAAVQPGAVGHSVQAQLLRQNFHKQNLQKRQNKKRARRKKAHPLCTRMLHSPYVGITHIRFIGSEPIVPSQP